MHFQQVEQFFLTNYFKQISGFWTTKRWIYEGVCCSLLEKRSELCLPVCEMQQSSWQTRAETRSSARNVHPTSSCRTEQKMTFRYTSSWCYARKVKVHVHRGPKL